MGERDFILSLSVEFLDHQISSKLDRAVIFLWLDLDSFEIFSGHSLTAAKTCFKHGLTCFINEVKMLPSLTALRSVSDFVLFVLQPYMSKD